MEAFFFFLLESSAEAASSAGSEGRDAGHGNHLGPHTKLGWRFPQAVLTISATSLVSPCVLCSPLTLPAQALFWGEPPMSYLIWLAFWRKEDLPVPFPSGSWNPFSPQTQTQMPWAGSSKHSAPVGRVTPSRLTCLGEPQLPWSLTLKAMLCLAHPLPEHLYGERGRRVGNEVLNLDLSATPPTPIPSPHMGQSESLKGQIRSYCILLTPHCFPSCLRIMDDLAPLTSSLTLLPEPPPSPTGLL